jgi:hypothetical protein
VETIDLIQFAVYDNGQSNEGPGFRLQRYGGPHPGRIIASVAIRSS